MYYVYPALFKLREKGGYIIKTPDVPGCVTSGDTVEEAFRMIKDALCACLCVLEDEGETPAPAKNPSEIETDSGDFIALIEADTTKYRSEHDNKSVRKNVSLPAWLNTKAEQANINCSQLLQQALKQELRLN